MLTQYTTTLCVIKKKNSSFNKLETRVNFNYLISHFKISVMNLRNIKYSILVKTLIVTLTFLQFKISVNQFLKLIKQR